MFRAIISPILRSTRLCLQLVVQRTNDAAGWLPAFSYQSVPLLFLKAFEFRKFWGVKSEVRRFQDGSISEAVVWCNTSATLAQKRMICRQIVSYLLKEKFDIPIGNQVIYVADQLDSLLARHTVRLHISLYYGIIKEKVECGMTKT